MTVLDPDQNHLMVALGVLPARLWVAGDPDWRVYAISDRLGVMVGGCHEHGLQDVIVAVDGQGALHALGEAGDAEDLGRLLASHPCLSAEEAAELLVGYQAARP